MTKLYTREEIVSDLRNLATEISEQISYMKRKTSKPQLGKTMCLKKVEKLIRKYQEESNDQLHQN